MNWKRISNIGYVMLLFGNGCSLNKDIYERNRYSYTVDLTNMTNDQIHVELIPPKLINDSIEFVFPVSELAYYNDDLKHGKLISNLQVYDAQRHLLKTNKKADNRWVIYEANRIEKLEYTVDDIWEVRDSLSSWLSSENIFNKGSVMQLSPNATFGYFDGIDQLEFEVALKVPKDLYLVSGLLNAEASDKSVNIHATNYIELSDYPLLFINQKPVQFKISNAVMEVGVYSEQGKIETEWVANQIKPAIEAISAYFKGRLPVEKYAFMIYFYSGNIFAATASEHNTSSIWVQPEDWDDRMLGSSLAEMIKNTALHEFLHIYAPLNIHSEEKLQFDFDQPQMSKHLWFYEGTTTYLQELIKVNQNLVSEEYFITRINEILQEMQEYRTDVSLTEISKETYGDQLGDQFDNVELRGFLVNMILDIKLREKSNGLYGLKNLIIDLCNKFGRNKSFKDDAFFSEISEITQFPELLDFLEKYVDGTDSLPLEETFKKVGYEYNTTTNSIMKMNKPTDKQEILKNNWLRHR
jgi:predicted metalloprotease with PDZ domain